MSCLFIKILMIQINVCKHEIKTSDLIKYLQYHLQESTKICFLFYKNELSVTAYFPRDIWYNFYTGKTVPSTSGYHVLEAPLDVINIHLRGGYILPLQDPELTTFRR